jgi:hypothetical protein
MERFYWIVTLIALLALIGILTYIGILMTYYRDKDTTYPPVAASCPDFWMVSDKDPNSCRIPTYSDTARNVGSTYVPAPPNATANAAPNFQLTVLNTPGINITDKDINFTHLDWGASTCTKQTWANTYGLVWDGVTNFNGC